MGSGNGAQQVLHATGGRNARRAYFGQTEAGLAGGKPQVTLQRQLKAATQTGAVDCRDDRLPDFQVGQVQ
ncbi:hypothetical protein D3C72_1805950 [compost metagenome]